MRLSPRERWIGGLVVAAAALYVWFTLQPDLLLSNTTTNGGDTGAHVWWPAFLRDHVLPHGRISGWTPDYYAGFPAGHFYFPVPAILVVLLDLVMPYNIAFKLVTVIGPVALPASAYYFAMGIKARWPAPPLFAAATLPFLFYEGYNIWGGNILSNLAGEFSFTISICFALCFLGSLARALEERRSLAVPAAFLAATVMSHLIVTIFAAGAAIIIWLWRRPVKNLPVAAAIAAAGGAITALWSLPLVARLGYTTDMGWTKEVPFGPNRNLLPDDLRWAFVLAVVGAVVGLALVRKTTMMLLSLAVVLGVAFVLVPESRLWNARLLPFYYLTVMFLAAQGVSEMAHGLARAIPALQRGLALERSEPAGPALDAVPPGETSRQDPENLADVEDPADAAFLAALDPDAADYGPPAPPRRRPVRLVPAWVTLTAVVAVALVTAVQYTHDTRKNIPGWTRWNYSGYETKPAWPEFKELIETMDKLPAGRALWEPSSGIDKYGTTLALELLPYFTDGKITSMEGLYFESSATVPYHFMMVAEVAKQPSNPVRDLNYRNISDFDLGVQHMKLFGVRYFMAQSDEAKAAADANPALRVVAETGRPDVTPHVARWKIYEVEGTALVSPLENEPVVIDGVGPHHEWLDIQAEWFNDPEAADRFLAAGGPKEWKRVDPKKAREAPKEPLPEVKVSGIRPEDDRISFKVDRVGVPVLVKTSYFPNWQASGAKGPWRVSPNLMVVVPTEKEVSLHYGRTGVDYAGIGLSILGLVGLVFLARWKPAPLTAPPGQDEAAGDGTGDPEATGDSAEEPASILS